METNTTIPPQQTLPILSPQESPTVLEKLTQATQEAIVFISGMTLTEILSAFTLIATIAILITIMRLTAKQQELHHSMVAKQTKSIEQLDAITKAVRRDELMKQLEQHKSIDILNALIQECENYGQNDKKLILNRYRRNPTVPLPGAGRNTYDPAEKLDNTAFSDYCESLESRYTRPKEYHPYPNLIEFLKTAKMRRSEIDAAVIGRLVCGRTAQIQKPAHTFYLELVREFPAIAPRIFYNLENTPWDQGALKLNIITGTLFALSEIQQREVPPLTPEQKEFKSSTTVAIGHYLHRNNMNSLDSWNYKGSSEPVSATVAFLISVIGWLALNDGHNDRRLVANIEKIIDSIPDDDKRWGNDDTLVREGLEALKAKCPGLWDEFGTGIERAATEVGPY